MYLLGYLLWIWQKCTPNYLWTELENVYALTKRLFYWNFTEVVPSGGMDNNPALVWIMAWHRIGDKPLSEPMLTWFTDAYMRHYERENELTVLDSTFILLLLTGHSGFINDDKNDDLHTSTPCLTRSVCVLSVHVVNSGVQSTIWVNRWEACMFKWINIINIIKILPNYDPWNRCFLCIFTSIATKQHIRPYLLSTKPFSLACYSDDEKTYFQNIDRLMGHRVTLQVHEHFIYAHWCYKNRWKCIN